MKRLFLFFFILSIAAAGLTVMRFYSFCITPHRQTPPVTAVVSIPEGSSLKKISGILTEKGLIRDPLFFTVLGRLKKAEHSIKSGDYSINLPLPPLEILEKLIRGDVILVPVTIPEGSDMFDIARIVEQSGLLPADTIIGKLTDPLFVKPFGFDNESLEGFLFPDTYKFRKNTGAEVILTKMTTRFKEMFYGELKDRTADKSFSERDLVTIASLVESETPQAAERPVIAGVFYNRLKKGMRLECDPTVVYGIKLQDPQFQGRLRKRHLQTPTRFNTYQIYGLPHGPICNPGVESIRAALRPAAVEYLYFVAKNNGTHQFSRTLEEHNNAVNQYQR